MVYRMSIILIFLWFLVQAGFYATQINKAIFPDEPYHEQLIEYFKEGNSPFDATQVDNFNLGDTTRVYYLYHYLLAKTDFVNPEGNWDLIAFRLINVLFILGSLIILFLILRELIKNRWVHLAVLIMISNTTMFAFMAGSVNYDNLQFLVTMLSIFLLLKYMSSKSPTTLLSLLVVILLGSLVKVSFLGIFVAEFIILAILVLTQAKYRVEILNFFKVKNIKPFPVILIILFIVSTGLFAERYIKNILVYHSFSPECNQIHTFEECKSSAIFVRNTTLAQEIDESDFKPVGMPTYLVNWSEGMADRIFGIAGHKVMPISRKGLIPYLLVFLLGGIFFLRYERFKDPKDRAIFFVTIFYLLILLFYQNYRTYLNLGSIGIGLQGRYLFPVLPFIYYFTVKHLFRPSFPFWTKVLILAYISIVFVSGSLPWFLRRADSNWYFPK